MAPSSSFPTAVRVADLISTSRDDRSFRRAAARGHFVRVARGAYVRADEWAALSPRERFVVTTRTHVERLDDRLVASHWSAAAIWGFPVVDAWPNLVHVIDQSRSSSNRTTRILRRPGLLLDGEVEVGEGIRVTSPARTACDLALSDGFRAAVLVMDFALHGGLCTKNEIRDCLERQLRVRPRARAAAASRAVDFADELTESAAESFSRIGIHETGFPPPVLQKPLEDELGEIGRPDFSWLEYGVLGEVDGDQKYVDPSFMNGLSAAEVVRREKERQRRFENLPQVRRVVRWSYAESRDPRLLATILQSAGLPRLDVAASLARTSGSAAR